MSDPTATAAAGTSGDDIAAVLINAGRERRHQRANDLLTPLSIRERLLVKEAAVMGFVRGNYGSRYDEGTFPSDQEILIDVLSAMDAHRDLYPTITGYEPPEDEDD